MEVALENGWQGLLEEEFQKPYFKELQDFLGEEEKEYTLYPRKENFFTAFQKTPFESVKVVILGQDPYHGENQAHGLSFSVQDGIAHPPSLRNIFKELHEDMKCSIPQSGNLNSWAKEGVFLLNTVLSVRSGEAHSHRNKGWEIFTDAVIKKLSAHKEHVVFILWGAPASSKIALIDETKHCVLQAPHPSPLSSYRGFFGSKPFSKANTFLTCKGLKPILWSLA